MVHGFYGFFIACLGHVQPAARQRAALRQRAQARLLRLQKVPAQLPPPRVAFTGT